MIFSNPVERPNSTQVCVISPNSVTFGAHYVKVVEDTPILPAAEMWPKDRYIIYGDIGRGSPPER